MGMNAQSKEGPRRRIWRSALLLFVLVPFLPEIMIAVVSAYAQATGCSAGSEAVCLIGTRPVSDFIRAGLFAAIYIGKWFAAGVVAVWLVACYGAILLGWARLSSRLLMALSLTLIFSFLPYIAPMLSIGPLANLKCSPNEGGVPPGCPIYGGAVGDAAHEAVRLVSAVRDGLPFAVAALFFFVVVAAMLQRFTQSDGDRRSVPLQ
ncbi:hypothetical protein C7U89_22960 [Bradyrhizobium sp. WBOS4]|nr:hypothetical protein [Bradyrhizobium sp. WBOS8]MDD1585776.1 hypothetical protein [Bradyrhizobium sp. WBOS4]UUO60269.1 hypothetical protein DCM80_14470 [Bradyrhizobium sp. WBOS08]